MATGASALLLLLVRRSWLRPMAGKKRRLQAQVARSTRLLIGEARGLWARAGSLLGTLVFSWRICESRIDSRQITSPQGSRRSNRMTIDRKPSGG